MLFDRSRPQFTWVVDFAELATFTFSAVTPHEDIEIGILWVLCARIVLANDNASQLLGSKLALPNKVATDTNAEVPHNNFDTILVLDFGSQTSHLILRRLRALSVCAEMLPCAAKLADLTWKPKDIVLSRGPSAVYDEGSPHVDHAVFELGLENTVTPTVTIHKVDSHTDRLFAGLGETMHTYMSYFNKLVRLPGGFVVVAKAANSEFAGIAHQTKPIFGVQFHPELEHTPRGTFHTVHIDNGLMRPNKSKEVKETLKEHLRINLTVINSTKLFLNRLKGVTELEKKCKIIGETFIDLLEKEAIRIEKEAENTPNVENASWLLQGTLYPDVIESLSFKGPSATIKTHHKIHKDLLHRFPFPGPGIGVRILGECTHERI
ncbi:class I glutamine amidotransferase-like protein [Trichoderma compactum]